MPKPRADAITRWAYGDPATKWAKQIVSGELPAGQLMKLAAKRHLDDKEKHPELWHKDRAAKVLEFFPRCLTVTAGAKAGEPFHLPGFLSFVVGSLFGWYTPSGRLRFREAWLELPKGQVKTPLAAAVGLYLMGWHNIRRAEVYSIAKDRTQANVLFSRCGCAVPHVSPGLRAVAGVVRRGSHPRHGGDGVVC
jgi:phage terminase large subunit-like protein